MKLTSPKALDSELTESKAQISGCAPHNGPAWLGNLTQDSAHHRAHLTPHGGGGRLRSPDSPSPPLRPPAGQRSRVVEWSEKIEEVGKREREKKSNAKANLFRKTGSRRFTWLRAPLLLADPSASRLQSPQNPSKRGAIAASSRPPPPILGDAADGAAGRAGRPAARRRSSRAAQGPAVRAARRRHRNGCAGAENQCLGLLRALGLADRLTLYVNPASPDHFSCQLLVTVS